VTSLDDTNGVTDPRGSPMGLEGAADSDHITPPSDTLITEGKNINGVIADSKNVDEKTYESDDVMKDNSEHLQESMAESKASVNQDEIQENKKHEVNGGPTGFSKVWGNGNTYVVT